jgi:phage tail tube protein FII
VNWITIDIMAGVFEVFGVDRMAEIRAAVAD